MAILADTSSEPNQGHLADTQRGAVAAEYAILLSGVAVAIVATIGLWGSALVAAIDQATSLISSLV